MLLITNDEVEKCLTMPACVEALDAAYRDLGNGAAVEVPRQDGVVENPRPGAVHGLKTMSGSWPAAGVAAVRIDSDVVHWPVVDEAPRRVKIPLSQGNRYNGIVLLFSTETGELLAIFNDGYVQKTRVGATSGVAARYLAREDAEVLGLIGSGWQATGQIEAMAAVRPLRLVKVFSPRRENRDGFAERYRKLLGIEVRSVESADEAADGVDILVSATNSMSPTVQREWLRPGLHVTSVRASELSLQLLEAVDHLVVHTQDMVTAYATVGRAQEIPEFINGDYAVPDWGDFKLHEYPELKDVVAGKVAGRTSVRDTTCFHNFKGLGLQFAAMGSLIYSEARKRGYGHEVDDQYFSQLVHP
ncbi:MAG TPA: ornithine cyclodeaminase family protein [Acidimicrobiales bacterium]|nr:ornithine cyclodeaminase family protein [Acidimicrobiales bacterium]